MESEAYEYRSHCRFDHRHRRWRQPYPASGSDHQPAAPEPAAQLQTIDIPVAKGDIGPGQPLKPVDMQRQSGTLSLALRCITDINMVKTKTDDQPNRRGESISAVRYGVASQQSVQK